jgi:hypothetical protein
MRNFKGLAPLREPKQSCISSSRHAISKQATAYNKVFDQIVSEFKPSLLLLQFHTLVWRDCPHNALGTYTLILHSSLIYLPSVELWAILVAFAEREQLVAAIAACPPSAAQAVVGGVCRPSASNQGSC